MAANQTGPLTYDYGTVFAGFAGTIDEVRALLQAVVQATGPDVLAGGRLAESLDELITASQAELRAIADELESLNRAASDTFAAPVW